MNSANKSYDAYDQFVDISGLIKFFIKYFKLILVIMTLAAIAGGIYCYFVVKPLYNSRTLLLVTQVTDTIGNPRVTTQKDDINSILSSAYHTPLLTMNTYITEIKSEVLMQRVIDKLHLDAMGYTSRSLASQINATVTKDSNIIEITVNNNDPGLAVSIANTLTQEFIAMTTEKNRELMDRTIKFLQEQTEVVKNELAQISDPIEQQRLYNVLGLLSEGLIKTQIARNVELGSTNLVIFSPAMRPYQVMSNKLNIMIVALILGLVTSVGIGLILELISSIKGKQYSKALQQTPENLTVN